MNSSLEHWLWIQPKVTNRLKAAKLSHISQNSLNHSSSSTERVKLYFLQNSNTFKAVYHHSLCHRIFHSHAVTWTAASSTDSGYNQRYQTDSKQQNCRIFLRTHWIIPARALKEWSCISSTIQIPSKQYIIIHYVIESLTCSYMNSSLEHWLWIQPKVPNRLKAAKLSHISQNSLNHSSSSTERVKLYFLHNSNTFKAVYHPPFCNRIFHSHAVTWTAASSTDSGYNQR
jgi:hypothetical protein